MQNNHHNVNTIVIICLLGSICHFLLLVYMTSLCFSVFLSCVMLVDDCHFLNDLWFYFSSNSNGFVLFCHIYYALSYFLISVNSCLGFRLHEHQVKEER
jgi:hypothetical protein